MYLDKISLYVPLDYEWKLSLGIFIYLDLIPRHLEMEQLLSILIELRHLHTKIIVQDNYRFKYTCFNWNFTSLYLSNALTNILMKKRWWLLFNKSNFIDQYLRYLELALREERAWEALYAQEVGSRTPSASYKLTATEGREKAASKREWSQKHVPEKNNSNLVMVELTLKY